MRRCWFGVVLAGLLMGCGDDAPPADSGTEGGTTGDITTTGGATEPTSEGDVSSSGGAPLAFCEGASALRYDPAALMIDAFPDDVFTRPAETATGLEVHLVPGETITLVGITTAFGRIFDQASTLDGFGTTSSFFFRVEGTLDEATLPPASPDAAAFEDSMVLIDLDADPPAAVPFEWSLVPETAGSSDTTVLFEPMQPLLPARRYGVAMTHRVADTDGGCVAPSGPMLALLQGAGEGPLAAMQERVDAFVSVLVDGGTIRAAEDLSAAVVFTTQTTLEDTTAVAEEIRSTTAPTYSPEPKMACAEPEEGANYVVCRGTVDAVDFTGEDEALLVDTTDAGSYDLPVVVYLPLEGEAPFPTMVYGHGLGGDRNQAELLADLFAPAGMAVVAVDAPKHGDHPDAGDDPVLDLFGLSLNLADPLDAVKLRDNFRQATFDRLQLVETIRAGLDADDDGTPDLDGDALHYLGVSLGGVMGPGVVAYAPEFLSATFVVPGARSTSIVRDGENFSSLIGVFAQAATDGEIARFFPVVQSVIDRGDAGVFAPHVLEGQRLPGFDQSAPQVLIQMVIDDDTVPNSTNRFFARAVGAPHVGEALQRVGVISHEPALPTAANVGGTHTAGLFQFDRIEGGGVATHSGIAVSEVGQLQIEHFVRTAGEDGTAEILDPYAELGIE